VDRNAEPPASAAAATNGKTGKQQLQAARTLAIAARLMRAALLLLPGKPQSSMILIRAPFSEFRKNRTAPLVRIAGHLELAFADSQPRC